MAPPVDINYWAVLAAAAFQMVLGFLWYGPLFGKQWMKLMGFNEKSMKGMNMTPLQATIGGVVTAWVMNYVLAHFVDYTQAANFIDGATAGAWIWLGFIATVQLGSVLWEGKPVKLYVLNTAYYLVALVVTGGILAAWA